MAEDDVKRIARKISKILDGQKSIDSAGDLIRALADVPMTLDILQKTKIGALTNDLRKKTADDKVASEAKKLIKAWKKLLAGGNASEQNGKPMVASDSCSNLSAMDAGVQPSNSDAAPQSQSQSKTGSDVIDGAGSEKAKQAPAAMKDDARSKCRRMILDSLRSGDLPEGTLDPEQIADSIEECLFQTHRGTNPKYMAALRSRVFNLRDKKNRALCENVLTGVIKPARFATMSSEEMASAEMRTLRTKFTKDAINEHQLSQEDGTPTDMFKCGKCRGYNCTYRQAQTRSADEPMTTFVLCRGCGNRWKGFVGDISPSSFEGSKHKFFESRLIDTQ